MTQPGVFTPYSTIPWSTTPPSWVPPTDQARINSYQMYEELYWSHINTNYKVMSRDQNETEPIYVPASRIMIEAVNRYVGKGMTAVADPLTGSPASRTLAATSFASLFARERFESKYDANKRYGLIRGDWCWHVLADPNKPEGTRISLIPVDPASYFPVFESDIIAGGSPDKIVKVHLAERVLNGDKYVVRRQTYEKVVNPNGTITIWSSLMMFDEDKWFLSDGKPTEILSPLIALPAEITAIPVYHVPNFATPGDPFGSSELRGLETVVAAVNQAVTDEDLALALMGLGVYATDQAGSPRDAVTGEAREWFIYPGAVIENSKGLRKVEGVTNVSAYTEHIGRLFNFLQQATGAVDAAVGRVDVQVAESGVALMLNLAPMLSKAEESDRIIRDVHGQLFYDLRAWFKSYEKINLDDVIMVPVFGDKLPTNKAAEITMVVTLMSTIPPVLSAESARKYLASKGIDFFAENEAALVQAEQTAIAQAAMATDPLTERANQEAAAGADGIGSDADAGGSEGGNAEAGL